MPRKRLSWHRYLEWIPVGLVAVFVAVNWDSVLSVVCSGYWPQSHIETLHAPVAVRGWSSSGLRLADGRVVPLPGFRALPESSVALATATRRGVEVEADGRVVGLVKIWHWCGNDALQHDVRRVDIGHLLEFLREGSFTRALTENDPKATTPGGCFTESGWSISDRVRFVHFEKGDWRKMFDEADKSRTDR